MYTYAFLKIPTFNLTLPLGIAGPVQLFQVDDLGAIVEPDVSIETLQQNDQTLLQAIVQHDLVTQAIFQQTTILPLRFGTCFNSSAALQNCLASQRNTHLKKIAVLTGKAEYTLQLHPQALPAASVTTDIKGKDYFIAKKQLYAAQAEWQQQQQAAVKEIVGAIAPIIESYRLSDSDNSSTKIYLLVQQAHLERLQHQLKAMAQHYPTWTVELSNPLPPYNFVE